MDTVEQLHRALELAKYAREHRIRTAKALRDAEVDELAKANECLRLSQILSTPVNQGAK